MVYGIVLDLSIAACGGGSGGDLNARIVRSTRLDSTPMAMSAISLMDSSGVSGLPGCCTRVCTRVCVCGCLDVLVWAGIQ